MRSGAGRERIRAALRPLAQIPLVAALRRGLDPDPALRRALARQSLLLQFESLGENCEFAFVQEHLDAHPLGLFRWSGVSLDALCLALETGLEGIGEPEHMDVHVEPSDGEYHITDTRYGMDTHTAMFQHDRSPEEVVKVFSVRMRRLKEKLLEDLAEGRKIFVFQRARPLGDGERDRLQAALVRHGPRAELLCVHPAADPRLVGTVRLIRPGLMVGWLDRVGLGVDGWRISYQLWLTLLARAARLSGRRFARGATASLSPLNLPERF